MERERVFERFYRGAAARAGEIEGSGLGLAIARWAAERLGGRVHVEPGVTSGNVFVVDLPLRPVPGVPSSGREAIDIDREGSFFDAGEIRVDADPVGGARTS